MDDKHPEVQTCRPTSDFSGTLGYALGTPVPRVGRAHESTISSLSNIEPSLHGIAFERAKVCDDDLAELGLASEAGVS